MVVQHTYSPGSAGAGARVHEVGQHCCEGVSLLPAVLLVVSMRLLWRAGGGLRGQSQVPPLHFCLLQHATLLEAFQAEHEGA